MAAIDVSVRVFFGLEYSTGSNFTLDDPVKGVLDNATYLIAGADGDGVELADDGYSISVRRGRSRELDEFETGTATVSLHNFDRAYDALNTAGVYYGDLVPGKRIEIRVFGQVIFAGTVEDWNIDWTVEGDASATLFAVDSLGQLARKEFDAWTTTGGQAAGARLTEALDRTEIGFGANRNFDVGVSTLQADSVTWGSSALNYANLVVKSDGGRLYASRTDVLTFDDRHALVAGDVDVTFADDGSGVAFHGVTTEVGSELLFNRVGIDREGGTLQTVEDATSMAAYGVRALSLSGLLMDSDSQSEEMAEYLLGIYKDPTARVSSIMVKVHDTLHLTGVQQAQMAALEISDLVDVVWTPLGIGTAIPQVPLAVEGLEHQVSSHEYVVTAYVAPIGQTGVFILDDAVWGVLDTGPGVLAF